jgi:type I restriction enzyme S subunit
MSWPRVTVGYIKAEARHSLVGGPFGSELITTDYVENGIPVIRGSNLPDDRCFDDAEFVFVREEKADQLSANNAHPGDVVFTQRGTLGQVGFIPVEAQFSRYLISQSQMKLSVNPAKADAKFVYYYFRHPDTVQNIKNHAVTSGVPHINLGLLREFELPLPPVAIQREIASILAAYDDLIENNRRRMALLEKAARLLYEEWFVRLRFPGHEHMRFVANGMPKGWERKPLGELTTHLKRGIAPDYDDTADGLVINQKCIRDGHLHVAFARRQSREFGPERQLRVGDVLVNSTGEGTLGRVAQVKHAIENCTVDTHVTILRPRPGIPIHYFGLAVMAWEPRFSTMGRGATNQTELSPSMIGEAEIALPLSALMDEFLSMAAPIYDHVTNLTLQVEKARSARDLLLPRLMSGEIAVCSY